MISRVTCMVIHVNILSWSFSEAPLEVTRNKHSTALHSTVIPWPVFVKESDVVGRIPQVWIFIVALNNCPPATFKQIIPSPDPGLHNAEELLPPAPVLYHQPRTTDSPTQHSEKQGEARRSCSSICSLFIGGQPIYNLGLLSLHLHRH